MINKNLFLLLVMISLAFPAKAQQKHFISDAAYLKHTLIQFEKQKKLASARAIPLFDVFKQNLTLEEKEALTFLYAYMPLNDMAEHDGAYFLAQIRASFAARDYFPYGKTIPEDIFRHFVLPYRINNENMDTARLVFYKELKERLKGLSMKQAALEVNHWCHERVAYQGCDSRTSAPLSTIKNALGRCGEESTFTVTAMRAAGIPARQCYTPRWAHCDDNHAWVEVWIDGKWHFLGACEPDADLDLGWFAAPSKRAMMVNTTVYGYYKGKEEVLRSDDRYTQINLLANYAPVKTFFVKVVDATRNPVNNAKVEFQLYNYAEFYPLAKKFTSVKGITSLQTGYGDLLIWANKGNNYGYQKVTVESNDTVIVVLNKKSGKEYTEEMDLTPPVVRQVDVVVNEKDAQVNSERLKQEDKMRHDYEATFIDSVKAFQIANQLGLNQNKTYNVFRKSRGNWKDIAAFLSNPNSSKNRVFCLPLLESISEKDLHDVTLDVLFDHLNNTKFLAGTDTDMFVKYVMNPRIGDEMIKPYKEYFQKKLGANNFKDANQIVLWIKTNIKVDAKANYYRVPITPKGVFDLKVGDAASRDMLFVALCRSFGICARLEPATKVTQYYAWNGWKTIVFEKQITKDIPKATLTLENNPANGNITPEYSTHFSIEKFSDGKYNTLDYEEDAHLKTFPCMINVDAGDYLLVTGTRLPDGTVMAMLKFFKLVPDQKMNLSITLRKAKAEHKIIGKINPDNSFIDVKTNKTVTINDINNKKNTILLWVEVDKEPTRHAVIDIAKLKANFDKWDGNFAAIFNKNVQPDITKLNGLPQQTAYFIDKNDVLKEIEKSTNQKLSNNLPVFVVLNEKGEIIYLSNGYKIGAGEMLLKLF